MPTPHKEQLVASLTAKVRRSKTIVLMQAQGLSVSEQTTLRRKLRAAGDVEFQVVKNTLFRIATHDANVANVDSALNGPTAVAFGYDDEITVAKAIADYIRTSKIVTLKAGILGKQTLSVKQIETLATLPGRDGVRSQAVGALQGPAQEVVGLLSAPLRDLAQILRNYAEKQGASF